MARGQKGFRYDPAGDRRAMPMAWQKVGLRRSLFFAAAPNANSTLHTTLFGTSEFATVAHRTAISLSYREVLVFAVFAKVERNYDYRLQQKIEACDTHIMI